MSDKPIGNRCSWCGAGNMGIEACPNGGDICVDCCVKAGDPCGHEPKPESHTYVTHLQFSARDDEHARQISARIVELITDWQAAIDAEQDAPLMLLAQGYAIEAAHLTDADDWGEHVPVEDVCFLCGGPGTNRRRTGNGQRICGGHWAVEYPIEDVSV